jgi:hypothetical protein
MSTAEPIQTFPVAIRLDDGTTTTKLVRIHRRHVAAGLIVTDAVDARPPHQLFTITAEYSGFAVAWAGDLQQAIDAMAALALVTDWKRPAKQIGSDPAARAVIKDVCIRHHLADRHGRPYAPPNRAERRRKARQQRPVKRPRRPRRPGQPPRDRGSLSVVK